VTVSRSEQQAVVERFLLALRTGRLQELLDVMAPDVVMITDGGGVVAAGLTPFHGAELVAGLLARASEITSDFAPVWLNGAPAIRIDLDGEPSTVSATVADGRITGLYVVRNPHKLTRLDEPAQLTR
jgi:RNA polymerase sigma-70 factor (ECF subfamily)